MQCIIWQRRCISITLLICSIIAILNIADSANLICPFTKAPPEKPLGLIFCRNFNRNACCIPPHDVENQQMFESLVDTGRLCRIKGDQRKHPLAIWYCLTCDPDLPTYLRGNTVLICESFADALWNYNDEDQSNTGKGYNECGLNVASPCGPDQSGDRYDCGDDIVIPSLLLNTSEQFLNLRNLAPPGLSSDEGYTYKVIRESELNEGEKCFLGAGSTNSPYFLATSILLVSMIFAFT